MIKTLWLKDEYLQMILSGCKTVEVRVAYDNIKRLQPDDQLCLNEQHPFVITRVGKYANFDDLLAHEDPDVIAPGLSREQLLTTLRQLYPRAKENLGVVALEIKPEKS